MNKVTRKLISAFLALALVITTLTGNLPLGTPTGSKALAATTVRIHFYRPSQWTSTPKIYAYNENNKAVTHLSSSDDKDAWKTRKDMTADNTKSGWYYYDVQLPTGGTNYVCFTNGSKDDDASYNRFPSSSKAENVDNTRKVKLTFTGEVWYSLAIDTSNKTTPMVMTTSTTDPTSTAGATTAAPTPSATSSQKTYTVHLRKPSTWDKTPKIYSFVTQGEGTVEEPTGDFNNRKDMIEEGVLGSDHWYKMEIPVTKTGDLYVIFTNGSSSAAADRYPKSGEGKTLLVKQDTWYYLNKSLDMKVYTEDQTAALATATPAVTPTVAPTATVTPTVAPTATVTPTVTPTVAPTATVTPTVAPTATVKPTVAPTATPTVTPVVTNTPKVTATPVVSATPELATPTIMPTATTVIIDDDDTTNGGSVNDTSVTGTISFSKKNKTVGETVKIKLTVKNATTAAAYSYIYRINNKVVKNATTSKTYTWTTTKKGKQTISVDIIENGTKVKTVTASYTVKARVITIKKISTSKKTVKKGKKLTITVSAKTTKGKLSYKFAIKKGSGKIKVIRKYSKKKTATWKPTAKGSYTIYVYAKNGKGVEIVKTKKLVVK